MANRMISYGYGIEKGRLTVIEREAEIVREILDRYLSGQYLKQIADGLMARGIPFYEDRCNWNKNTVAWIIENGKYIGRDGYPEIVDYITYERANRLKAGKGQVMREVPAEADFLKGITYCGQCRAKMQRRAVWNTREKWLCPNGCKKKIYIADKEILGLLFGMIERIALHPQALIADVTAATYKPTPEIMRYTNEIVRMVNGEKPSFAAAKRVILNCAGLKFLASRENKQTAYTDYVAELTKQAHESGEIGADYYRRVLSRVTITEQGELIVRFINDAKITSGTEVTGGAGASCEKENNNED